MTYTLMHCAYISHAAVLFVIHCMLQCVNLNKTHSDGLLTSNGFTQHVNTEDIQSMYSFYLVSKL